ncbi:MAG: ectoine/hydroxyectoine ABC transporter substrate-binding protein EhuB [Chloroflexi bacterium]|nr:ectoine/hydroxyectoine ABC transporter substrate-binding protein EhuB [Chloroflexota bacterium]
MNIPTALRARTHRLPLLGVIVACAIAVAALWPRDESLTPLQRNNVIRIGYAVEAPYAYIDSDGNITGESPEIAKVIVASLGIMDIEWIQTDFDLLISGLLSERFDVVAAGMFITPERAQHVRFSDPTFHVQPGLLVRSGNPLRLHSYEDSSGTAGAMVAVISGAVEESFLRELGVRNEQFIIVPDALTGKTAVVSGLADALALSSATVRWVAANDQAGAVEAVDDLTLPDGEAASGWGYGAFVFQPSDHQLVDAWNTAQRAFIGRPEHLELIARFGFTAGELPGTRTS